MAYAGLRRSGFMGHAVPPRRQGSGLEDNDIHLDRSARPKPRSERKPFERRLVNDRAQHEAGRR